MNYKATERFKSTIDRFLSKGKHYGCIKGKIYQELHALTDAEIFNRGYSLSKFNGFVHFSKIRLQSCGADAKSAGFRLITLTNKAENCCYLLDAYPKTGPFMKSNMKSDERKDCLNELKAEKKNNTLLNVRLNPALKEMEFI